jgi:hypothetical protein
VLEVAAVLDRHDRLLHHRRDLVVLDEDAVLVAAKDGEDPPAGRVVDPRVALMALPCGVEFRHLARDRGDEAECERRRREDGEGKGECEQAQLPDPAPPLRRRRFSATAKTQDRGSLDSRGDGS